MDEVARLRMALDRVRDHRAFAPADRIWWLYLREAVQSWLEKHEDADLRAAHHGVKAFPENLPDEGARWLDLRIAVVNVLERYGKSQSS